MLLTPAWREMSWLYTRPAFGRQGRNLAENNFKKEKRDWLAVLLREILQNGLDARAPNASTVEVRISRVSVDSTAFDNLLPGDHYERLRQCLPKWQHDEVQPNSCLVVEDFGTIGLTGYVNQPEADGAGQNWNAFWFREGEGGKEHSSGNGGAGQGKITYFSTSSLRTIFAYTVRADEPAEAVFGASSFSRDYDFKGHKWLRDAYWGLHATRDDGSAIAVPSTDTDVIDAFRSTFNLARDGGTPGLSLVIPGARKFDEAEAIQVVIAEFFAPIIRGDLVVSIGSTVIGKGNIESLADSYLSDERARELRTCMTHGFRQFYAAALSVSAGDAFITMPLITDIKDLTEKVIDPVALETMRSSLNGGDVVSARLMVKVKQRDAAAAECAFDVHLQLPDDLDAPEQVVLRRDLLIGEEPIGGGRVRQRARSVTLINDGLLSRLLLCAEEPTHLKWNASLPKLSDNFKDGASVVSIVRNAAARLLDVLCAGERRRDFKLLAKYFAAPGLASAIPNKGPRRKDGKNIPPAPKLPPARPQLLSLEPTEDGCRILPGATLRDGDAVCLPISADLEFAYEGLDKDAFAEYDPHDFDLADTDFLIEAVGCAVDSRVGNRLHFRIATKEFYLRISGFDRNLRLRMRMNYEEVVDAATFEAE